MTNRQPIHVGSDEWEEHLDSFVNDRTVEMRVRETEVIDLLKERLMILGTLDPTEDSERYASWAHACIDLANRLEEHFGADRFQKILSIEGVSMTLSKNHVSEN